MPFHKFSVEPVQLSRKTLPPDKPDRIVIDELETITNNTLVKVLQQLASLVKAADVIFFEVSDEFQKIHKRTEGLKSRLAQCEIKAKDLNAKRVTVPVGDLRSFSIVRRHFKTDYAFDTSALFTPSSRPTCVEQMCLKASNHSSNPLPIDSKNLSSSCPLQRFLEHYYWNEEDVDEDKKGYRFVVCRPVIGDSKWRDHLDIETRKPSRMKPRKKNSLNVTIADTSCSSVSSLPVTENLKEEIEGYRESGSESDFSELPSPEERVFALSMEYPSTVVSVDTSGKGFNRMATLRRSLIHTDFLVKRKKRKHRRPQNSTPGKETKSIQTESKDLESPSSSKTKNDFFESVRFRGNRRNLSSNQRSSLYASVDIVGPRPEPKKRFSMDPKALYSVKDTQEDLNDKNVRKSKGRSFLPISTVSAAMTMAVKLRGSLRGAMGGSQGGASSKISRKARKEEGGQSSSGNWSATSSVRGSLVDSSSDAQRIPNTSEVGSSSSSSRSSIEKDSLLSKGGKGSDLAGYTSDGSTTGASKASSVKGRREARRNKVGSWNGDSHNASDRSCTPVLSDPSSGGANERKGSLNGCYSSSSSRFTSPKLPRDPRYLQNGGSFDDESESVYSVHSVDTDGYYTSMHTDSGLKNSISPKKTFGNPVCRRESISSVSTIGNISINSILSRSALESDSNQSTLTYKAPPTPPPRAPPQRFSLKIDPKDLPPPPPNPSPPEEEEEGDRRRLELKTKINSSQYPLMCTVSPETSDEERRTNYPLQETPSADPLDKIFGDKGETFVPLGLNMYGDSSARKALFSTTLPETPPYSPTNNEDLVLSSFSANSRPSSQSSSYRSLPSSPLKAVVKKSLPVISKLPSSNSEGVPTSQLPLIPLKYAQHITVTPMIRPGSRNEEEKPPWNGEKDVHRALSPGVVEPAPFIIRAQKPSLSNSPKKDLERVSSPNILEKKAAKVTLNSDGQVIFSSNSLGRRRDGHPMNYLHLTSPTRAVQRKYATLPPRLDSSVNGSTSPIMFPHRIGFSSLPRPPRLQTHTPTKRIPFVEDEKGVKSSVGLNKKPGMSNEDLFAAIHSSKKKLIKQQAEKVVQPVAQSNPPSPPRQNQVFKNELAESGCLSPRRWTPVSKNLASPALRQNASPSPVRPNLAMDRKGGARQTSMRDFKMLLSQKGGSPVSSPSGKKSASEILKTSAPSPLTLNKSSPRSLPGSPCQEMVQKSPNRPVSAGPYTSADFDRVSTVPLKRGGRGRLSFQTRRDNCPPILEDESSERNESSEGGHFHFRPITGAAPNLQTFQVANKMEKTSNAAIVKPSTSTWV